MSREQALMLPRNNNRRNIQTVDRQPHLITMIYLDRTIVSMVRLHSSAKIKISILADFTLNSTGGGVGDGSNFLPWHTSSHPSLVAALQMNTLPLG